MNSKPMLFECLECGETYLADNLCDGCNCPKCNGHIVGRGFIKEIEEDLKEMQNKINRAKENGLIRKAHKKHTKKEGGNMKRINIKEVGTLYAEGEVREQIAKFKLEGTNIEGRCIISTSKELSEKELRELIQREIYGDKTVTVKVELDTEQCQKNIEDIIKAFDALKKTQRVGTV
jgi:DNA-directed RNA polymerase subunit RPC12/RpoP